MDDAAQRIFMTVDKTKRHQIRDGSPSWIMLNGGTGAPPRDRRCGDVEVPPAPIEAYDGASYSCIQPAPYRPSLVPCDVLTYFSSSSRSSGRARAGQAGARDPSAGCLTRSSSRFPSPTVLPPSLCVIRMPQVTDTWNVPATANRRRCGVPLGARDDRWEATRARCRSGSHAR
jgi:hypothetical protein